MWQGQRATNEAKVAEAAEVALTILSLAVVHLVLAVMILEETAVMVAGEKWFSSTSPERRMTVHRSQSRRHHLHHLHHLHRRQLMIGPHVCCGPASKRTARGARRGFQESPKPSNGKQRVPASIRIKKRLFEKMDPLIGAAARRPYLTKRSRKRVFSDG